MNAILRENYGEDLLTFESGVKIKFRRRLVAFYEAHNPEHMGPEKLDEIVNFYFERQDQVWA